MNYKEKIKSLKKLKAKPWEMTPFEFFLTREDVPEAARSGYYRPTEAELKSASREHQDIIIRAMVGGKDVPPRAYRHLSKAKIEKLVKSEKERRKKGGQNWQTIIANYWKGNPEATKKIHAKDNKSIQQL